MNSGSQMRLRDPMLYYKMLHNPINVLYFAYYEASTANCVYMPPCYIARAKRYPHCFPYEMLLIKPVFISSVHLTQSTWLHLILFHPTAKQHVQKSTLALLEVLFLFELKEAHELMFWRAGVKGGRKKEKEKERKPLPASAAAAALKGNLRECHERGTKTRRRQISDPVFAFQT